MYTQKVTPSSTRLLPTILPMTLAEYLRLKSEVEQLASGLELKRVLAHQEHVSGDRETPTVLAAGDLFLQERRLETLRHVLSAVDIVNSHGRAVLGTSVTFCHGDDQVETYRLAAPGDANPRMNRISADSPLGAALLGRYAGDTVSVATPAGQWTGRILGVTDGPLSAIAN